MTENYQSKDSQIIRGLEERCRRICKGGPCLSADSNHRACVTDMLINKIWPVKKFIENAIEENRCSHLGEILEMAGDGLDEFLSFAIRLQEIQKQRETEADIRDR